MTRSEFAAVMAYITAGCGKPLSEQGAEVYFDLLADLPLPALQLAAKRSLLEGQYPTFPPAGVLRKLATEAVGGEQLGADEAWGLLRKAVVRFGYYRPEAGMASLPPTVRRAADCLGWREICDSEEPEIIRAQFRRAYEAVAGRERREALLPAPVKATLRQIGLESMFRLEEK